MNKLTNIQIENCGTIFPLSIFPNKLCLSGMSESKKENGFQNISMKCVSGNLVQWVCVSTQSWQEEYTLVDQTAILLSAELSKLWLIS